MKKIIITIDGHSACGKSTLAKALANELGFVYIDTGAMYRAVTFFFLENHVNIQKTSELERGLKKINISFKNTRLGNRTLLNGKDVEDVIRRMFVSKNVSHVSAISAVRKIVVKQQKEMGKNKGIVMEGRDIGTVVFPEAELKFFLTADEDVRAQRRFDELKEKGQQVSLKSVQANLHERDQLDSNRKDSPLKQAKDAILINNTNLTKNEQLAMTLAIAQERITTLEKKEAAQKQKNIATAKKMTTRSAAPRKNTLQSKQNTSENKNQPQNIAPPKKTANQQDSKKPAKRKNTPPKQDISENKNQPQKTGQQKKAENQQDSKNQKTSSRSKSTRRKNTQPKQHNSKDKKQEQNTTQQKKSENKPVQKQQKPNPGTNQAPKKNTPKKQNKPIQNQQQKAPAPKSSQPHSPKNQGRKPAQKKSIPNDQPTDQKKSQGRKNTRPHPRKPSVPNPPKPKREKKSEGAKSSNSNTDKRKPPIKPKVS